MTPKELSEKLWGSVTRVTKYLLPNGRREGHEWVVGSVNGEEGKSLKVNLSGKKVWSDFAEGTGGDLLDLWVRVRDCGLHQAMTEAKQFLGIVDDDHHFAARQKKNFVRPDRKMLTKHVFKPNLCYAYLESRGITHQTAEAFEIGDASVWFHAENRALPAIAFPYKRNGDLLQVKRISTERPQGKKVIMVESRCEPCLFGWQAIPHHVRLLILCEGEIDCMSYHQYGLPALSVPFGGGKGAKQQWIEFEYHNLDRFEQIWISMDNDDVGREAAKEIANRLGEYRCRLVKLPYKDINACLQAGMTQDDVVRCLETAAFFDPEELCSAREFYQDTLDAFYGQEQYLFKTPWEMLNHNFSFRESELTVLNGVNGHGKSEILGHLLCEAMSQGIRACVASFELKPGQLLKRLTQQAACSERPPVIEIDSAFKFYDDRLWVFGLTGTAKAARVIEIFNYARRRYGIQLFVIDSLMKCGIGEDDYNGQKAFVEALCDFKNSTNSHVILVTHSRKGDSEERPTGKMDVKGSGAITDLTDNLMIIWRNKARERVLQKQETGAILMDKEREKLAGPAAMILIEKQRNGNGWEGGIGLYLDKNSHQFLHREQADPYHYIANMPASEYDEVWKMQNVTEN
ncbi:toprim domain-containing protein [Xenorhabdus griffiniae]|uniref:toprim domain-containing protein n=1 Tax=Xenorhabdus griffiniae TaxID=351672 RepID=UPI0023584D58|nr:toprim domain-containing protein [Xenorhabdus griffiniae]MDC9604937.1 toprim domain-containing protein [Xenorhabdus griffiniae]